MNMEDWEDAGFTNGRGDKVFIKEEYVRGGGYVSTAFFWEGSGQGDKDLWYCIVGGAWNQERSFVLYRRCSLGKNYIKNLGTKKDAIEWLKKNPNLAGQYDIKEG